MVNEKFMGERRFEPSVYYCGIDKNITPGARYGPVTRDVYLVECCNSGYGAIIINNVEYPITPGCCYFLFPGDLVMHATDEREPREGYWCAIDGLQIGTVLKKVGISSTSPFVPSEVCPEISESLKQLYLTRDECDLGADLRRTARVYEILGALLRKSTEVDKNSWVKKATAFMETNYPDNISVASLAAEIGLDRSYFSTLFKAQTGMSPHAYLTALRIKKAASLMKEGAYSITEVAEAVGLDPQNFARLFKREVGVSPLQYKKEIRKSDGTVNHRVQRT